MKRTVSLALMLIMCIPAITQAKSCITKAALCGVAVGHLITSAVSGYLAYGFWKEDQPSPNSSINPSPLVYTTLGALSVTTAILGGIAVKSAFTQ